MSKPSDLWYKKKEANDIYTAAYIISERISTPKRCLFCILSKFFKEPEKYCSNKNNKECTIYIQKYLHEINKKGKSR